MSIGQKPEKHTTYQESHFKENGMKKKDLIGQRFGRLVVINEIKERKKHKIMWLCQCDCGSTLEVLGECLRTGRTQSCGCWQKETTSERFRKYDPCYRRIRNIFKKMKRRCYAPDCSDYYLYGARGITICDEWLDSEYGVQKFIEWSLNNGYQDSLSIDRIDNNKGYSPDNCRWTDAKNQARNRRNARTLTYNGETLCLAEWEERTGISQMTIRRRIESGWPADKALSEPINHKGA